MRTITRFFRCQSGATAIEYGLIITAIALVIIGALTTLGTNVNTSLQNVNAGFNSGAR